MGYDNPTRPAGAAPLHPDALLDQLVAEKAEAARVKKRGWVLDLASEARELDLATALRAQQLCSIVGEDKASLSDEEINRLREGLKQIVDATAEKSRMQPSIEFRESLPVHDEWEPPADERHHLVSATDSLISFLKRYGDARQTVVFVGAEKITCVLDDSVMRGARETVTMPFAMSSDWRAWTDLMEKPPVVHGELQKFLVRQEHTLESPAILLATSNISHTASVDHNSDYSSDGEGYGIVFKTVKGEKLQKFPKTWSIRLAALEQDLLDGNKVEANIRLEVHMPTEAAKPVRFSLACPEWQEIWRRRVAQESNLIREELPEFLVIHGEPKYEPRALGSE